MASSTFQPHTRDQNKKDEPLEKAKDAGSQAIGKVKEAAESLTEPLDKMKEAGAQALDKAKQAAGSVGEMASQAACAVGKKADDLTSAAGHDIKAMGDKLGQKGPQDGIAGRASHAVAETIKEGGKYLEEQKLSGMAHDVAELVKTHPVPAMFVCFGIGFILGRALKD